MLNKRRKRPLGVVYISARKKPRDWKETWKRQRSNPHPHKKLFSKLIKSLRGKLGLTQGDLAKQLGVVEQVVQRWERIDGTWPREWQWRRIRELWGLTKELKKDKFWKDRKRGVEFFV